MSSKPDPTRRLNRAVRAGDLIGPLLGPALKKRGFATRDLIAHWQDIAPKPYGEVTRPDRLSWPRNEANGDGARLFLRCAEGHAMAVAHDKASIAAAINRYFGYFLIGSVELSATPFSTHSDQKAKTRPPIDEAIAARVKKSVAVIEDEGLRDALRHLGEALEMKKK